MRRTGTDLMATGVIVGSTALAVAATLAFTRANPMEMQDSTMECTPHDAHWSVTYAITVDGAAVKSTPAALRFRTGVHVPRAYVDAAHRCRHLKERAEALRQRLEEIRELARQRRELREAVAQRIEADRAGER